MATILVRDLPDEVHRTLAEIAQQRRMSVNALVITWLERDVKQATSAAANRGGRYRDDA